MAKLRLAQANGRSNINVIRTPSKAGRGPRAMLSKTATYWTAGLGVAAVAAATPFILQYYWPGAALAPAPLASQEAPGAPSAPAAPPPLASAPAGAPAAPAPSPPAAQAAATPQTPPAAGNPPPA